MMKKMRYILILFAALIITANLMARASAAVFDDKEAGYTVQYDEQKWTPEDLAKMFGDITQYDKLLVGKPFVIADTAENITGLVVAVSKRDNYDNDMLAFIKNAKGDLSEHSIYEADDTFKDKSGHEFKSHIRVWGIAPEFKDEAILLSQVFFANGKRYELCLLALPDNFLNDWESAKAIMDSIDVK